MAKRSKKLEVVTTDGEQFLGSLTPQTVTNDGWTNPVAGMGIPGRDKGASTRFSPDHILTDSELDWMGRDGFSIKIVGEIVDDAMSSGWVVTFQGDGDEAVSPEEANEFNERLRNWYKKVKLKSWVTKHLKQSRHYGGAILALGVADGQSPDKELNLDKVKSFDWMRSHDRVQVSQSSQINSDPTSVGFGFPEAYTLYSATRTEGGDRDETMLDTWVHNSRVWRTDGESLSERTRMENQGWGDSVLQACREQLSNRGSTMRGARTVVLEWVLGVYKIKDFQSIVNANGEAKIRGRFNIVDRVKSIWQSIVVDADNESFERIGANASGLPELLDRFGIDLAAVAKMPMTKLFGLSPGGFGTGEAEGDNWDDQVQAYQSDTVEPLLEYIHTILFRTEEFVDFPANWAIQFNSLELTSPIEDADVRLKTAQKDALEITSGVVSAEEVALSRYGGATYSTETQLDTEEREMDAALAEEGFDAAAEPLTGIQISSMLDILERVKTGVLPKESALVAMQAAFPSMSEESARGMVDPIEVTGPVDPSTGLPPTAPQATPPDEGDGAGDESSESESDEGNEPGSSAGEDGVQ
jgi:phage-related protein (TIGR01555 family)